MVNKIKNAVQPAKWYEALPRKSFEQFEKLTHSHPWFEVYKLPGDVLAIYEPGHFQEVISFLIMGSRKALLVDTGMGIGNMKALVSELTNKEIIVVNSHSHFDHIGSNWQFPGVYIFNCSQAITRLKTGMPPTEILIELEGDSTCVPYPQGFDFKNYTIPASNPLPIEEGHIFDLGDRVLEVIHTPGHSPDSIMLLDRENSILFTGDTYYPATMYAHLTSPDNINSDFDTYQKTMRTLADNIKVNKLYASHNEPVQPGDTLGRVADAFDVIADGSKSFEVDEEGLNKYSFDGFAIVK